jgi:hypothetical protein
VISIQPLRAAMAAVAAIVVAWGLLPAVSRAATPPITVSVHQASGRPLSYFDLTAGPGHLAAAGSLEVANRGDQPVTVDLDPLDAVTISTLGSAYQPRGTKVHGSGRWTVLGTRQVTIAPHGSATVPVHTRTPATVSPGDYLSGIGVEATDQQPSTRTRSKLQIASVERYAIGLEVRVPGPRHRAITLTGAQLHRTPAGLTFYLLGRNRGNEILRNVTGRVRITQRGRTVATASIGPGTFVTGTSIAVPVLVRGALPVEGTTFAVSASMRYHGGIARLSRRVRFGHADAVRQRTFDSQAPAPLSHQVSWIVPLGIGLGLGLLVALLVTALRRRGRRVATPPRAAVRLSPLPTPEPVTPAIAAETELAPAPQDGAPAP